MLETLIINSLVVFGITLAVTKAKLFECTREFIEKRYQNAKETGGVGRLHWFWHAMWTCPMCLGFWVAIGTCCVNPAVNIWIDSLACFGLNWLLHCVETYLHYVGESFKCSLSLSPCNQKQTTNSRPFSQEA